MFLCIIYSTVDYFQCIFHFSYDTITESSSLLFIFSNSLIETSCSVHSFFSLILWSCLQSLPCTLSQIDCLSPLHLVLPVGFYLVPSFEICSSIASFCLTCFYFYVFDGLVTSPNLEEVTFCRRYPMFQHCIPLWSPVICSRGNPLCGLCGSFSCGGADYSAWFGRHDWPPVGVVVCQALPYMEAAHCCLAGLGHEAAGFRPWRALRLVLAHWWAELGSRRSLSQCWPTGGWNWVLGFGCKT